MKTVLFLLFFVTSLWAQNHILITEVVVTPTDGEFIEIYNNTGNEIDLSDYYLTDATHAGSGNYYYNIVTGANAGGGSGTFDFHARFPDGSKIASATFQMIAIKGSGFITTYGTSPTYELYETSAAIPNMREALSGSIDGGSTLTNGGEVVILHYWNGQTDLVSDIDYYLWGDKAEAVDKTGVSIDGPDGDSTPSTYLADTPIASQPVAAADAPHAFGESSQRTNLIESGETQSGGNGIAGHDETSESLGSSFSVGTPNPGTGPAGTPGNQPPLITNLTQTPENPGSSDQVTIGADVSDDGNVASVELFSAINDGVFAATNMTNTSGATYQAVLDSQTTGTVVKYYIKATDDSAATSETDTLSYTISSGGDEIIISNVQHTPDSPISSDSVIVTANITSKNTITNVRLFTAFNGSSFDSSDMVPTTGNTYQAIIDSQSTGTVVQYFVKAYDDQDNQTSSGISSYTVTETQGVASIAEIRNNPSYIGQNVTVEGVITIGSGILTVEWTDTYIQDNSGRGINVYRVGTPVDSDLQRGNLMRIEGIVEEFGGVLEIINYTATILATNQPLPDASEISTLDASGTSLEGTLVLVKGIITDLYSAGGGTNIVFDDGSGPATARAWDTAGINFSSYSVGDTVAIKGVMDIYQSAGQLLLAYQEDIEKTTLGPGDKDIDITKVQHAPAAVTSSDTVTVTADIIAKNTLTTVQLFTSFNSSAFDSSNMNLSLGNTFRAVIDSQAAGTVVRYYIIAEDNLGNREQTTIFTYTVTQPVAVTPIAEIRSNPDYIGQRVTVQAVVTIGSGILTTDWTDVYVQDNSGRGINVYRGGAPDPTFKRALLVRVEGEVAEFDGVLELINYNADVLADNQPLPEAAEISTDDATDVSWEGTYVSIKGVILELYNAGGGTNIVMDDGSGQVTVRAWDTAGLDFSAYAVGDNVEIKGVVDIYQSAGQVLLAYQEDISVTEIPKSPLMLQVPNKPFVPDQGETLPIIYSAGTENAHVTLRIYDMSGRLIATPVDETGRSFEQTIEWNGTDQVNEQVSLGAYILLFEVVDNKDGATSVKTAPVVVGTILKN